MNNDIDKSEGRSIECYFCNDTFKDIQLFQFHIEQCGSILEKCPNGCAVWVERRHKAQHIKSCTFEDGYRTVKSHPSKPQSSYQKADVNPNNSILSDNIILMRREMEEIRLTLNEERRQREMLKNEFDKLKKLYIKTDQINKNLNMTLTTVQKNFNEEINKERTALSSLKEDFQSIHIQHKSFREIVLELKLATSNLSQMVEFEKNERSHLELIVNAQDCKLRSLDKLEKEVHFLKSETDQFTVINSNQTLYSQQLEKLKDDTSKKLTEVINKFKNIEAVYLGLEDKMRHMTEPLNKFMNNDIVDLKDSIKFCQNNLEKLQSNKTTSTRITNVKINESDSIREVVYPKMYINESGHLLWRIDDYYSKMKKAIDDGIVFISPIFLTNKHGYTIQAELNLNGIGKSQERQLTITVYNIIGDYDPILEWPITLQADVIIKDQSQNRKQCIDITKQLLVKSQENLVSEKSKGGHKKQYISIPHTTLAKLDYVKNNVMFIEIIVNKL